MLAARSGKHYKRTMWATAWAEAAGEIRSEEAVGTIDNHTCNAETQTFETDVKNLSNTACKILAVFEHTASNMCNMQKGRLEEN